MDPRTTALGAGTGEVVLSPDGATSAAASGVAAGAAPVAAGCIDDEGQPKLAAAAAAASAAAPRTVDPDAAEPRRDGGERWALALTALFTALAAAATERACGLARRSGMRRGGARPSMASLIRGTSSGQGLRTVKVDEVKVEEVSTSTVAVSAAAPSTVSRNRFGALDGARLLASIHIVLGHGYQQGAFRGVYFFAWGYTWVPWFFMLSGFVLATSELRRRAPPPRDAAALARFVVRRTAAIYPLYVCGVVLALAVRLVKGDALPPWWAAAAQGVLAQSFVPWLPEASVQVHCWFLSALVPYWFLFGLLMRGVVLRLRSLPAALAVVLLLALPPWLAYVLPSALPGGDANWYTAHRHGQMSTPIDTLVILLKFHPICYLHVFVFGMALARLRHLAEETLRSPVGRSPFARRVFALCFRHAATAGYVGLAVVFSVPELRPPSYKLSARLSVLMVLQGLVLLGLAPIHDHPPCQRPPDPPRCSLRWWAGGDPVERLLSLAPPSAGNVSYSQYVLQFIAFALWPARVLGWADGLLFFVFLLSCSYLAATLIVAPAARAWAKAPPLRLLLLAVAVSVVLGLGCGIDRLVRDAARAVGDASSSAALCGVPAEPALPPPYVRVAAEAVDVRLNWSVAADDYAQPRVLINPSLRWAADGRLLRAARAHARSCEVNASATYEGETVTEISTVWHSDVALDDGGGGGVAAEAWASWDVAAWGLDGGGAPLRRLEVRGGEDSHPWPSLCQRDPVYVATNKTLLRTVIDGAGEDPKLLAPAAERCPTCVQEPFIAFSSYPPAWDGAACRTPKQGVLGGHSLAKYQMFHSADGWRPATPDGGGGAPYGYSAAVSQLQCGRRLAAEKNWVAFDASSGFDATAASAYVYTIYPHQVFAARADGSCVEDSYLTDGYKPLRDLILGDRDVELHGSATAERWDNATRLALFHTKDKDGRYATFAYKFASAPPYAIQAVSRPLPLQGGGASFASGLALAPGGADKVVVSYGAADAESRALVMSREFLEGLFDWSAAPCDASGAVVAAAEPTTTTSSPLAFVGVALPLLLVALGALARGGAAMCAWTRRRTAWPQPQPAPQA